jgi:beta-alanine--pyruvate transaminase
LLIFDEVITGFGRLGASFATTRFDVTPDLITCAKGLTNASVPAGAVITRSNIFKAIQEAAHRSPGMQIEFYHGYTYRSAVALNASSYSTYVHHDHLFYHWTVDTPSPWRPA